MRFDACDFAVFDIYILERADARDDYDPQILGHAEEHVADIVAMVAALLKEEAQRKRAGREDWELPFRPDHGQDILSDLEFDGQPGYPALGRLKGLAELLGIRTALS